MFEIIEEIVAQDTLADRYMQSMNRTDIMHAAGNLDTSLIKEFINKKDDAALGAFFRNAIQMHAKEQSCQSKSTN